MIAPSANLESDDVHIRCRVRRSPYASHPQFGEEQEMSCTMRNWQPQRTASASKLDDVLPSLTASNHNSFSKGDTIEMVQGPELLLRLVTTSSSSMTGHGRFSDRFSSFGSTGSSRRKAFGERRHESPARMPIPRPQRVAYCIPISDVVVADVHDQHVLHLTTVSHGFFEFRFLTINARDMMVAFLTASLSPERIVSQTTDTETKDDTRHLDSICSSFDVETFTANRIEERVRTESLSEKLRRRMAHVALQIGEMSSAISECACGCGHEPTTPGVAETDDSQRQAPSPTPPARTFRDLEYSSTQSVDDISPTPRIKGGGGNYRSSLEPELEVAL